MRVACIYLTKAGKARPHELAQACIRFSPRLAVREPDAIFIEIGRCLKLYSERSFVARAQVLLRRFGVDGTLALAPDLPSALALARFRSLSVDALPLEALVDFGDPFHLDPLGRKAIQGMIESLKRLGLGTIGQFRAIPASQLPSRFGGLGLYCRQRLDGASDLPWPHWAPPETYAERLELLPGEQCSHLEPLLFKAKELLDRLFSRLRGKFLRAERLRVSLELERYSTVKKPLREWIFELISPQGATSGFLPILRERLSRDLEREPIESFVVALGCEAVATTAGNQAQRHFFHARDDFEEAMGSLFGQLEEFLGRDRVFWAKITEARLPEKSWARVKNSAEPQAAVEGHYPLRPTRIFRNPIPVTVLEDRIALQGRVYKTTGWSQVERLALGWLDDCPARNYYRVDLEAGRALWIFSDPGHHFFAHGYFE